MKNSYSLGYYIKILLITFVDYLLLFTVINSIIGFLSSFLFSEICKITGGFADYSFLPCLPVFIFIVILSYIIIPLFYFFLIFSESKTLGERVINQDLYGNDESKLKRRLIGILFFYFSLPILYSILFLIYMVFFFTI